jgi:membrane fusion protein (multidrug efflux system)
MQKYSFRTLSETFRTADGVYYGYIRGKQMKKKIFVAIIGLILFIGLIGGVKYLQIGAMIAQGENFSPPPITVTAAEVKKESWESLLNSVGSLSAVQGVILTAELSGKITEIAFTSGTKVRVGDLLLKQDTSSEEAQLRAAEAAVALAKLNFTRAQKALNLKAVSASEFDRADAEYKSAMAGADAIRTLIAKKTIRAPFSGRLGIRMVNPGQNLKGGEEIVSLQAIDPIYVNFLLPQHQLEKIQRGFRVRITSDAISGRSLEGKITAMNPQLDDATRSIRVQATIENAEEKLRPGMFVNVAVVMPEPETVLTVPATAVLYAPYSNSVFVIEQKDPENESDPPVLRQQFVRTGKKHGDYVAIESGLKEGEQIVSTGVFKMRNGQAVVVDNSLSPEFKLNPEPENS